MKVCCVWKDEIDYQDLKGIYLTKQIAEEMIGIALHIPNKAYAGGWYYTEEEVIE